MTRQGCQESLWVEIPQLEGSISRCRHQVMVVVRPCYSLDLPRVCWSAVVGNQLPRWLTYFIERYIEISSLFCYFLFLILVDPIYKSSHEQVIGLSSSGGRLVSTYIFLESCTCMFVIIFLSYTCMFFYTMIYSWIETKAFNMRKAWNCISNLENISETC